MGTPSRFPRRRLLTRLSSAAAVVALAGCSDGGDDGNGADDGQSMGDSETDGGDADDEGSSALDLREANVVDVSVEAQGGTYTFDVTLHHDDDGEEGYANWWQVERLDGTRLGRRDLLHAHSQQPFTRSETMDIPAEVSCVVVRGHDRTHGYGGLAAVTNLDSGAIRTVDQGEAKRSFDAGDCP